MANGKHRRDEGKVSARAFLVPAVWIAALLAGYVVLADWQTLPGIITSALASI
jgi:hypothetical protein